MTGRQARAVYRTTQTTVRNAVAIRLSGATPEPNQSARPSTSRLISTMASRRPNGRWISFQDQPAYRVVRHAHNQVGQQERPRHRVARVACPHQDTPRRRPVLTRTRQRGAAPVPLPVGRPGPSQEGNRTSSGPGHFVGMHSAPVTHSAHTSSAHATIPNVVHTTRFEPCTRWCPEKESR